MERAPGERVSVHAHAKVNLALAVGPPEPSGARKGWHPICSWMAPITLGDSLLVTRLEEDRLSRYAIRWAEEGDPLGAPPRSSPIDWSITRDLAVRAHRALEERAGRTLPVQALLDKRTPVGGGLGGGSSDAAAMLRAVRTLFSDAPLGDLREAGAALGSDVAFFLDDAGGDGAESSGAPRAAIVEGFGDRIERLGGSHAGAWLVLLCPDFGCPTPAVYGAFDDDMPGSEFEARAERIRAAARGASLTDDLLFNDLASPAERIAPMLRDLREHVRLVTERPAHVTGSGSTMFLLAESEEHAAWLCGRIAETTDAERLAAAPVRLAAHGR